LVQAEQYFEEALRLAEVTGDRERYEIVLSNLGYLAIWKGNYDEGERLLKEALQLGINRGYHYRREAVQFYLGFACANRGDFGLAITHFEEGIQAHRRIGADQFLSVGYINYSLCCHYAGDDTAAEAMAENAVEVAQKLGDGRREGGALVSMGHALAAQDRFDEAVKAYSQGLLLHRKYDRPVRRLEAIAGLARVAERTGNFDQVSNHIQEILHNLDDIREYATEESFCVYQTCYQILHQRQDPRATNLLRLAYQQLEQRASSLSDAEQQRLFWDMAGHREIERAWRTQSPS
jgi:tetratricopeptide (TPR) repeat protein